MGLESISDPDDMNMDGEDDDDSTEVIDGEGAEERPVRTRDDDGFFDTRSTSISPSSVKGGAKGSEVDTEEDPIGPITPGPNSTFEVDKHEDGLRLSKIDDFEEIGHEDEDDEWVDPSINTPLAETIERPYAPQIAKTKSTSSTGSHSSKKGKKKGSKKGVPMPVGTPPTKAEAHFPFPRSLEESFHERSDEIGNYEKRMNNARARDGGRTESGGVKAVLTEG